MKKAICLSLMITSLALGGIVAAVMAEDTGSKATSQEKSGTHKGIVTTASKPYAIIGHLESKNRRITIAAGPHGPLYTIKTKEGQVLATRIDEKSLQAKYPDIYAEMKTGVAGNDATLHDREIVPPKK
jgi:hypothetical protein